MAFSNGVRIGRYLTKPCQCYLKNDTSVIIILKEGKNRQIRRMCWTLGYEVVNLKRTRMSGFELDDLTSGKFELQ